MTVVSHWMAPYLDLNDRNIASNLHKDTHSNAKFWWATMVSILSRFKRSPPRWWGDRCHMALNGSGGDFLHRWYFQDGELSHRLFCPGYLLTFLELFLLLKSSTIGYTCYLATNTLGKQACKYRVFEFSIITWTVRSCWSAVWFFLVVDSSDSMHLTTLSLTWRVFLRFCQVLLSQRDPTTCREIIFLSFFFFLWRVSICVLIFDFYVIWCSVALRPQMVSSR